jgi:hypothetical protein
MLGFFVPLMWYIVPVTFCVANHSIGSLIRRSHLRNWGSVDPFMHLEYAPAESQSMTLYTMSAMRQATHSAFIRVGGALAAHRLLRLLTCPI